MLTTGPALQIIRQQSCGVPTPHQTHYEFHARPLLRCESHPQRSSAAQARRDSFVGKRCTQGPGVTDKWLETQIHEGVSADVAKLALQRGYLFDYPWRLNGKNKIDRSMSSYVLMENESCFEPPCPEGSYSQVHRRACSATVGPWWTAPRRRAAQLGQPSFSAEAHVRRCPEREAQCRHRLPGCWN